MDKQQSQKEFVKQELVKNGFSQRIFKRKHSRNYQSLIGGESPFQTFKFLSK